jgi:hypothetical protein
MLNLCGIGAAIMKMATRNFPMSGFGSHFQNGRNLEHFENTELLL